jgi:hypothetical protein
MGHRPSQRANNVRYYAANREREIARVTQRQAATASFLRQLRDVPCADCGIRFLPIQMEFDHRDPAQKSFTVAAGRSLLTNRATLIAEIAKCDVVCVNCHRIRTRARHRAWLAARTPSTHPRIEGRRARWRHHADILDQLRSVPCADCGGRFPPCAMDFDHRDPSTKTLAVTRLINRSYVTLMAEVAKCDIVCANCHHLRTHARRTKQAA